MLYISVAEKPTKPSKEEKPVCPGDENTTYKRSLTYNPNFEKDLRKLFSSGLPIDAKEAQIKEHFGQFGEIKTVDMATGRSRGFCDIVYKSVGNLEKEIESKASQKQANKQNGKRGNDLNQFQNGFDNSDEIKRILYGELDTKK